MVWRKQLTDKDLDAYFSGIGFESQWESIQYGPYFTDLVDFYDR